MTGDGRRAILDRGSLVAQRQDEGLSARALAKHVYTACVQPRRCYNEWAIDTIDWQCRLHVEFANLGRP